MKATVIKLCFVGIFFMILHPIVAQDKETLPVAKSLPVPKQNFIKLNVTSLLFSNVGFQYERLMNKHFSIALGLSIRPLGNIPLKNYIVSLAKDDAYLQKILDQALLSNSSITPELRWYPGKKGYGRGFYLAPFIRFANSHIKGIKINYSVTENDYISLSGNLKTSTYGLLMGAQWHIGKNICLDWQIIGPHIGSGNGTLTFGTGTNTFDAAEQSYIKNELNKISMDNINTSSTVTSNSIKFNWSSPWSGLRTGISLGFKF